MNSYESYNWVVPPEASGLRLIDFIKEQVGELFSNKQIKRAIEQNSCRINGRTERFASHLVGTSDKISFYLSLPQQVILDPSKILYQDAYLLACDKPPGISSEDPLFLTALGVQGLKLIHRLDKETSGVLLFAKTEEVRLAMIALFQQKRVSKIYYALVDGELSKKEGIVDNALGKLRVFAGQTIWGEVDASKGQSARTEWNVEKRGQGATLLRCMPITGRTHQIRVHLSSLGHPILGDHLYGRSIRHAYRAPRCLLHAFQIQFAHPVTQALLRIQAPLPEDMQKAIREVISCES